MTTENFNRHFTGPVHRPGEPAYDEQRAAFSPAVDAKPAYVVEAANAEDVRRAVLAAREHDLRFAVQGTGHGTLTAADDAVLVKTGRLTSVLVDPDRRVARVGAGTRWSDVIAAATPFGLAPLSGTSPSVGVAGYTFGGGMSWLSRRHGYAADSLLRVEGVDADGERIVVTADRDPELFWAIRGGSGNFMVATSLEFRLHPVPRIYGGTAHFPRERAAEVLAFYRDWAPAQPDELTTAIVVSADSVAVRVCYAGDAEAAERALRPLSRVTGEQVSGGYESMTYADSGTLGGTAPLGFELLDTVPDDAIAEILRSPAVGIELRYWGGAMGRPAADAGPVGHRDTPFSLTIHGSPDVVARLRRHATGKSFLNFLHDTSKTASAYTVDDFARLRAAKRRYDPDLVFTPHHTIEPAPASSAHRVAHSVV
ncbi:FAD-binding oxidoreductase [Labedaea rhizosphaerae]|uniref:Berberine-like enzyme n=1 Tax=Labedaea rhizosphaerae TaxID=598644 RepID=A0A4R6S5F3_LABRH|nr:FAD-dependent oxidoreductase [Labedaea rhizosphaerae]TDP95039.1 berberine-like enzyme [Labedaea rhizosphaerae]